MREKIVIPMYILWLNGLYGLHRPRGLTSLNWAEIDQFYWPNLTCIIEVNRTSAESVQNSRGPPSRHSEMGHPQYRQVQCYVAKPHHSGLGHVLGLFSQAPPLTVETCDGNHWPSPTTDSGDMWWEPLAKPHHWQWRHVMGTIGQAPPLTVETCDGNHWPSPTTDSGDMWWEPLAKPHHWQWGLGMGLIDQAPPLTVETWDVTHWHNQIVPSHTPKHIYRNDWNPLITLFIFNAICIYMYCMRKFVQT